MRAEIWRGQGREAYEHSFGVHAGAMTRTAARLFKELEADRQLRLARKEIASDLIHRGDEEGDAVHLVRREREELLRWDARSEDL